MNLQQIEYVLAVAETLSFSKAAKRCFIAQSTLSTMVGRFEDEVGVLIFNRRTKPTTITQEGQVVVDQLRRISGERRILDEVLRSLRDEWSGTFRIGVLPTIAPFVVPRFLPAFAEALPALRIRVSELQTEDIIQQLRSRSIDAGIVATPLEVPDMQVDKLYDEAFVGYDCRDGHDGRALDVSELGSERLWLLEEGHCIHTQVQKICSASDHEPVERNVDFLSGSIHSLMKYVRASSGVTLLPLLATIDLSDADDAALRPLTSPVPVRSVSIITRQDFVRHKLRDRLHQAISSAVRPLLRDMGHHHWVVSPS